MSEPTMQEIVEYERRYATATKMLNELVSNLAEDAGHMKERTGIAGGAVLFDRFHKFLVDRRIKDPLGVAMTEVICAAALTKLAQASRGEDYDMAQFETAIKEREFDQ